MALNTGERAGTQKRKTETEEGGLVIACSVDNMVRSLISVNNLPLGFKRAGG